MLQVRSERPVARDGVFDVATGIDDLEEAVDRIARAAEDKDGFAAFMKEAEPPWN